MRIEWKEDSARAVVASLDQIRQETQQCMRQARQVEAALKEADPDRQSRRLKAMSARFEATMRRLDRAAEEVAQLEDATNQMIRAFEDSESEAVRLLNGLDPGWGTAEQEEVMAATHLSPWRVQAQVIPPIVLPRPRIAPRIRFSAMGPILSWLMALIDRM